MAVENYKAHHANPSVVWECSNEFRVVRLGREHEYDQVNYALEQFVGCDSLGCRQFRLIECPPEFVGTFDWVVKQLGTVAEGECRRAAGN